ncbi:MAG: hypothetical protein KJ949_02445 [Nanoarchaeota archaeon]|nr:hypothetical protein [Nanoarchaeota archaeon]MBU4308318.1 hypothetical protein [Nanoarchaeota archaeon]
MSGEKTNCQIIIKNEKLYNQFLEDVGGELEEQVNENLHEQFKKNIVSHLKPVDILDNQKPDAKYLAKYGTTHLLRLGI